MRATSAARRSGARRGRAREAPPGPAAIRRRTAVAGVPAPAGPFAWSLAYRDLLFISGIRGTDPATGVPVRGDAERVGMIFAHLGRILEANGCTPRDVLATRVYVTAMRRHRPLVNEAFIRFFGTVLPTRTIVEVRALNQNDTIEVEVVAARRRPPSYPRRPRVRR